MSMYLLYWYHSNGLWKSGVVGSSLDLFADGGIGIEGVRLKGLAKSNPTLSARTAERMGHPGASCGSRVGHPPDRRITLFLSVHSGA